MAQRAARRKVEAEGRDQQLLRLIEALPRPVDEKHPTRVPVVQVLADNILRMDDVLRLLHGSRPLEGDPMRKVYDTAIKTLEEGKGTEGAIQYLERAICGAFESLAWRTKSLEDLGPYKDGLHAMLQRIREGLRDGTEEHMGFRPAQSDISAIWRLYIGGPAEPLIAPTDKAAVVRGFPPFEMWLHDIGPVHLITGTREEAVLALNADASPTLVRVFLGNKSAAENTVNKIAGGYAALTGDPRRMGEACQALYEALEQIPMEEFRNSDGARTARILLAGCTSAACLRTALEALGSDNVFAVIFEEMNNLYIITVNQRAVAVMRAGVTVRWQWDSRIREFQEFINAVREGHFAPNVLSLGVALQYVYLIMSGQLEKLQLRPTEGGGLAVTRTERERVAGAGHVFSVTPSVTLGAAAWGTPMEIVLHVTTGYREWEVGKDIPRTDGTIDRISVGDKGAFLGLWGAEVRFPGAEGRRARIRLERVGGGVVGLTNPLAYITISGTWHEDNAVRIRSFLTPQYAYFLRQHRPGAEFRPIDLTVQTSKGFLFKGGVGFRYELGITPEREPVGLSHTYEAFGELGFRFMRGVDLDIRAGFITEEGGPELRRAPRTPFGAAILTLTPGTWFKPKETRRRTREVVPRRAAPVKGRRRRESK